MQFNFQQSRKPFHDRKPKAHTSVPITLRVVDLEELLEYLSLVLLCDSASAVPDKNANAFALTEGSDTHLASAGVLRSVVDQIPDDAAEFVAIAANDQVRRTLQVQGHALLSQSVFIGTNDWLEQWQQAKIPPIQRDHASIQFGHVKQGCSSVIATPTRLRRCGPE